MDPSFRMFDPAENMWDQAPLFRSGLNWDESYSSNSIRPNTMDMDMEMAQWAVKPPTMHRSASNYSPVSGRSPTSGQSPVSTGPHSPFSVPGHSFPEHTPNMGSTPGIASYDDFGNGGQYNFGSSGIDFAAPGMDMNTPEMAFPGSGMGGIPMIEYENYGPAKGTPSVGEYNNNFQHVPRQHGSVSSICTSVSSVPTSAFSIVGDMRSPSIARSMASSVSPVSTRRMESRIQCSASPSSSALSYSPVSSRRPSQAFNQSHFSTPNAASRTPFFSQSSGNFVAPLESSYPSILHATYNGTPISATQSHDALSYTWAHPGTPLSHQPMSPMPVKAGSQSPYHQTYDYTYPTQDRRPSQVSYNSDNTSNDQNNQKQFCTYPDCGKAFKDIKAHMLTHQATRPEKCPIVTCEYFNKGFSRRYDRNRHTLTHYKGTMVCGFCEGAGSPAEKSFNRADVFKRHLIKHHKVEQTPPNSRKKVPSTISTSSKKLIGKATGNCSTCSSKFTNAQDFYEHLDECILRVVQQEEPSEAINAARLAEVEQDTAVHDTLRNNQLPTTTHVSSADEDEDDEEMDDDNDESFSLRARGRKNRNPKNGVQKTSGLTRSKGGVTLNTKSRRRRKDYPSSWGCQEEHMTLKKRVLCTFNGTRRLQKDDMMLKTNHEVRMSLAEPNRYVTDFDYFSLMRAEGMHGATDEERGPDSAEQRSDNPVGFQEMLAENDIEKLMETGTSYE